jgi:hypothetical protein
MNHFLFAERFEGFDTKVLEVSTAIISFMDVGQRACTFIDDKYSDHLLLTHCGRMMRILVFTFQAWKTDGEHSHH